MSDPLPRLAVSKARLKGEVPDSEESERSSYQLTKLPVLMALSQQIASSEARGIQLSNTSGLGRPSANNQALSSLLLEVVQSKHIIKKKIKEKSIVWTEFPQSRRAAEKGGNKDSALGKLLLRKIKQRAQLGLSAKLDPDYGS